MYKYVFQFIDSVQDVASFPGPAQLSIACSTAVLQATESWATESLDGKLSIGDGKLSIACSTAVLQATESWAGPGNEAIQDVGLLLASLTQCVMPRPAFEQEDVLHSCSYVPQLAQTGKQC